MNRCATCRHWNDGSCLQIENEDGESASRNDGAWLRTVWTDTDVFTPVLQTRADFGCVLWEEK